MIIAKSLPGEMLTFESKASGGGHLQAGNATSLDGDTKSNYPYIASPDYDCSSSLAPSVQREMRSLLPIAIRRSKYHRPRHHRYNRTETRACLCHSYSCALPDRRSRRSHDRC
jgi:hypothetical protein